MSERKSCAGFHNEEGLLSKLAALRARVAELEAERAALEGELDDIDETEAERDHARAQLMDIAVALGVSRTDAANPPYLVQAVERLRAERDEALAEVARLRTACGLALNAVSDYDGMGRDPVLAESLLRRALPLAETEDASDGE